MSQIQNIYVIIGLCLFGMSTASHAQMYKWVDEEGVTQYSQTPPVGQTEVETIKLQTTAPNTNAISKLESQIKQADSLREKRLEDKEIQQIDSENAAIKAENCRRSRARLASYSVPNGLILQADGSRLRVDEQTRLNELATSRDMIKKYCD